jgi:hypothetical protein
MKEIKNLKEALILGNEETFFILLDNFYKRVKEENTSDEETFLNESESMEVLKITSNTTLWMYRTMLGLPYYQIGKRVILYRKSDLISFIKKHKVS